MDPTSVSRDVSVALTIAGSDSGANAGIQADLLTFAANGVFGTTALTCLTAQNPTGITRIETMDPTFVIDQIQQVTDYYPVRAIKTGMLFNSSIIRAVADRLADLKSRASEPIHLVVDPVMVASSGETLLQDDAIEDYQTRLLPLADLITPNLDEARVLLDRELGNFDAIAAAARELSQRFETHVLVKGGHLAGNTLVDILSSPDGKIQRFEQYRIHNIDTHGSGCTLSSACAARLARGEAIEDAVRAARAFLRRGMESPVRLSKANFINHLP